MVIELELCVFTKLHVACFVVDLVCAYIEFEVAWSVLINVLFYYSGFAYYGSLSKLSWIVSLVIDEHHDL